MECLCDIKKYRVFLLVVGHAVHAYAEGGGHDAVPSQDGKHGLACIRPPEDGADRMTEFHVGGIIPGVWAKKVTHYMRENRGTPTHLSTVCVWISGFTAAVTSTVTLAISLAGSSITSAVLLVEQMVGGRKRVVRNTGEDVQARSCTWVCDFDTTLMTSHFCSDA